MAYGIFADSHIFSDAALKGITDIAVITGTTYIAGHLFEGCVGAVRISIPDGVEYIGEKAFKNCCSLREITIPSSVTNLDASAFSECYSLTNVTFEGDAPTCQYPIFDMANRDLIVRVKKASKGWNGDPESTELPDLWPQNNEAGRRILHVGEAVVDEPTVVTNYIFSVVTIHIYHHDVVTDMTAYHTTVTNVHVHFLKDNTKAEFILPSSYDTGFVNVVAEVRGGFAVIPATWSVNYAGFTDRYGSDFTAALSKPNGKYDASGNPMFVWQDYVAGTNPMDVTDVFNATIVIIDGKVKISHTPELDAEREALRKYTVYGKRNLLDSAWEEVADGDELEYNFYKVTVEMK